MAQPVSKNVKHEKRRLINILEYTEIIPKHEKSKSKEKEKEKISSISFILYSNGVLLPENK